MSREASLINDCFLHDKDRLRHHEALELLRERLGTIADTETIEARDALGRIVAQSIGAPHDVPLHTNAAVDGYAFRHGDFHGGPLPVSDRIAAGDLDPSPIVPNSAVRILTGAPMPPGAETVAMQEDCTETNGLVKLPEGLKRGANCRLAGEDLQAGSTVIKVGRRLRAADLAAMASVGIASVDVYRRLKVALFSSGNELRQPGDSSTPLKPGQVFDANRPLISALLQNLPVEITTTTHIGDTASETFGAIQRAATAHDIIIATGGASRGDEDHMLTALDKLGKRHLWQLAIKPGRPMMFGQISRPDAHHDCLFFGLPGNPVAAMVCFLLYARPALLRLAGGHWETPMAFPLPAGFDIDNKKPDRREFIRGRLEEDEIGNVVVQRYGRDGSGLISSLRESDGLIEISEAVTSLKKGELVSFLPFNLFS